MAFKLKLDNNGNVVLQDGKPVYTNDNGKDEPFDMNEAFNKMHSLGEENKKRRLELEEVKKNYEKFKDLDLETVKKNAEIAAQFKENEAVKNGEIETLKAEIVAASEKKLGETKAEYERRINALLEEKQKLSSSLHDNIIGNQFYNSPYVKDELAVPADMIKAMFGSRFKLDENQRVYAVGEDGRPLLSEKKLSEVADFEEAMELIIKKYPNKEAILKAKGAAGGGMNNGGRGGKGDSRLNDENLSAENRLTLSRQQKNRGNGS